VVYAKKEHPVINETTTRRLLLTVSEFGEALGIGRTLAYELVLKGKVPSVKIGRARRVPAAAVEAYVARLADEQEQANEPKRAEQPQVRQPR
jgi:excisionase family DNA binding protein